MNIKENVERIARCPTSTKIITIAFLFTWAMIIAALLFGVVFFSAERPGQAMEVTPGIEIPLITVEPALGAVGDFVTVQGENWPAGEIVFIYVITPDETQVPYYAVAGPVTDPDGHFVTGFVFPAESNWIDQNQAIVIAQADGGRLMAQANFIIVGPELQPTETPTLPAEPTVTPAVAVKPTPTAEELSPTPTPQPDVTATTDLNIRAGPGLTYPVLGILRAGQTAAVTGISRDGNWWQIKFLGVLDERGWVSAGYVETEYTDDVPVVQASALPATPTPTPLILNWRGEYYPNRDLAGASPWVRDDSTIAFNWGTGSAGPNLPLDNFSVRWTRMGYFDEGLYRFQVLVDDGVRLFIDETPVIDSWHDGGGREEIGERWLSTGQHSVRLEYYEHTGEALVRLEWEKITPYASFPDWKGEYWSNRDLSGSPTLVRNDVIIDFDWGLGSPAPGVPVDDFSIRWTRSWATDEGRYRFHLLTDDGARLWVDNHLVIDRWWDGRYEESGEYHLNNGSHDLRLEYYEHSGHARVLLWAEQISRPPEADFRADPRSGAGPLRVEFDNRSDGDYDHCKWDFGDGDSSRDCDDPNHTYWEPGVYTVRLKIEGPDGSDTKKKSDYIRVYERPEANFTASPTEGVAPLTVNFSNRSTNYDTCLWDFGDGQSSQVRYNPSHTYTTPGIYTVSLTVYGPGGSDTNTKTNYIAVTEPPTPETPTPETPTPESPTPVSPTPETPTATPGTPTTTPETPTTTPETSTSTPGTPTTTPETPTATPGTPTATPGTPTATPDTPTATPGTPTSTPGTPTSTPGTPTATPIPEIPMPETPTPETPTLETPVPVSLTPEPPMLETPTPVSPTPEVATPTLEVLTPPIPTLELATPVSPALETST